MYINRKIISTREDLRYFIEKDKASRGIQGKKIDRFDDVGRFLIVLRNFEYYTNLKDKKYVLLTYYYKYQFIRLSRINNFSIPPNVFGPGLAIAHRGTIVVNPYTIVGENCQINVCVNIGARIGTDTKAPQIGNNVYIGPGVKIYGDIKISDGIAIGANAVVNRSFYEENITIAGVPAKKIKDFGSSELLLTK